MKAPKHFLAFVAQWQDLEKSLISSTQADAPISIDSALDPTKPNYSSDRPTVFRERHGWCPYSERVWVSCLAMLAQSKVWLVSNSHLLLSFIFTAGT